MIKDFIIISLILINIISLLTIYKYKHHSKRVNIDNLTGLNNMYYLENNYKKYLLKNDKVYLLLIDFRNLKIINDNYGHNKGDECLIRFADLISSHFTNSLLIRRSGDEFIIVTNYSIFKIEETLMTIDKKIKKDFQNNLYPLFEFNVGIYKATVSEKLKEDLEKADQTMYEAKSQNKLYVIHPEIKD